MKDIDDALIYLGASLFNQKEISAIAPKKGLTGLLIKSPSLKVNKKNNVSPNKSKIIRNKLGEIVKKPPEVMVKISGGGKGMRQIKDHLDYISRNGKLDIEDQEGDVIKGKEEISDLRNEWEYGGFQIAEESEKREAFNIILSMPSGTDALSVKRAARDFAAREFYNHQYVMALHTFETDPDSEPSPNPHVHLCVKAKSLNGTRLNPRKVDLQRWRDEFAEALREHGVDAASTNRVQRLKLDRGEKQSVKQLKQRGKSLEKIGKSTPDLKRVAKAKKIEIEVLRNYREITQVLATSEDVEDRKLAIGIVGRLNELQHQIKKDDQPQEKDRDIQR